MALMNWNIFQKTIFLEKTLMWDQMSNSDAQDTMEKRHIFMLKSH